MPDVTDCLLLPYPLLTDTPDVPRDIQALAERADDLLCGTVSDINELKTQMLLRVRKAGDTMTGTLILSANTPLRITRPGNAPFMEFTAFPGPTPRYAYIQAQSDRLRYDVESSTGFHHWVIGSTEQMRLSPGGILDVNQVRTDVRMTAGAPSGLQLALVDTQPVAAAPTTYMGFYNNGTVSALGTRNALIGFPSTPEFRIMNEVANADLRISTASGGDVRLASGTNGHLQLIPGSGGDLFYGAGNVTRGVCNDTAFLFGRVTNGDLANAGVEILHAGSGAGAIRTAVGDAGVSSFYARRTGAANADDQWFYQCINGAGSSLGGIRQNGTTAVELVGTATSDYRVKEVLGPITDAIERFRKLRPIRYVRTDDDTGDVLDGFLAHEVAPIVPEAVSGVKDGMEPDGVTMRLQEMHAEKLVPLLTAVVMELLDEVAMLKERCCGEM